MTAAVVLQAFGMVLLGFGAGYVFGYFSGAEQALLVGRVKGRSDACRLAALANVHWLRDVAGDYREHGTTTGDASDFDIAHELQRIANELEAQVNAPDFEERLNGLIEDSS